MWKRNTYYFVKPFLPWSLRMTMRRWRAERQKRKFANKWPINQSAGQQPPAWPGWPQGKRFSLVLTHDVERRKGMERCLAVMDLEMKHGFRSSFNFVPEGDYKTPKKLRDTLTANGFEVGVHDLKHDGKLYNSRKGFLNSAQSINRYLKEWNAVGFRSGFMHHNLEWLLDLDVTYDASTFDTDPFEPQPDAANTIFPFRVNGKNGRAGYVELPYTLPQDSTLFLLFNEENIDIWKRKLDWVVERGGMALLNSHPDYMAFGGERSQDEFPVRFYEEFLEYANEKYRGLFWAALPREVAKYFGSHEGNRASGSQ